MVKADGKTFSFDGTEKIDAGLLETFPYEYAGRAAEVVIECEEWNCVCPFSGLPDFGTLTVRYEPAADCLELKSLKYYITTYRTVGIYQEHAAYRLLDDLVAACHPRRLEVTLEYRLRGGIRTVVTVRHPAPERG